MTELEIKIAKDCKNRHRREYARKWREKNREHLREYNRNYHKTHKEKELEYWLRRAYREIGLNVEAKDDKRGSK